MTDRYEIIDIGLDPTRAVRSPFYEMEKRLIALKSLGLGRVQKDQMEESIELYTKIR